MKRISKHLAAGCLMLFLCIGSVYNGISYDVWAASKITITFQPNKGITPLKSKKVTYKGKYGELPVPTRKGYTFTGWYTKKSGGSKKTQSSKVIVKKKQTLYAHWTPVTYQIQFDGNESSNGAMKPISTKYGAEVKLTANKFQLKGCTFLGWSLQPNGKVAYKNKATVKNLTNEKKTVTLYAVWKGKTSTTSRYESAYADYIAGTGNWEAFQSSAAVVLKEKSSVIPGLAYTNYNDEFASTQMTPQGTCIAGNYLLISAYDYGDRNNAVIYVKNRKDGKYVMTLVLNIKSHVGALAYDEQRESIYIADTENRTVWTLSLQQVQSAVAEKKDSKKIKLNTNKKFLVDLEPAFMTYYDGRLFVGNFERFDKNNSYMIAYSFQNEQMKKEKIYLTLPLKCQGIAFADYQGKTYLICSCSYGRTNPSNMYIYQIEKTDDDNWIHLKTESEAVFRYPNMSEDIDLSGNELYTCFESGSNPYKYKSGSKKLLEVGVQGFPIDRVLVSSLDKMFAGISDVSKEEWTGFSLKNHEHNYQYIHTVDPTCGTYGYDLYQCKCGEEKYENRTEMKGDHQFKTVEETDDSIAYECEVCSAYYAEDK